MQGSAGRAANHPNVGARDIKLASIDALSVVAGFVSGAAAVSQYARSHPPPVQGQLAHVSALLWVGLVSGLAVTAAVHYLGLRMLNEPLAGASSASLLTILPTALALGAVPAVLLYRAAGHSVPAAVPGLALAAVMALATPAIPRGLVHDFCAPDQTAPRAGSGHETHAEAAHRSCRRKRPAPRCEVVAARV